MTIEVCYDIYEHVARSEISDGECGWMILTTIMGGYCNPGKRVDLTRLNFNDIGNNTETPLAFPESKSYIQINIRTINMKTDLLENTFILRVEHRHDLLIYTTKVTF